MKNIINYLQSCLEEFKEIYVNGFNDFMTLIEEKKVQDALSWADTFKWDGNKLDPRRQEVREKMRKLASEQSKDPVTAFKLLDILQRWQLNSVALDSLQNLDLEFMLLDSLVRRKHFCEFWELLSQIQLRVKPQNFDFRSINLFSANERDVHKLRKDSCEKVLKKCREILSEELLPLEIKTRMDFEISTFEGFSQDLKKQEEEMRKFLNDVLSKPLLELTARVQSAENRATTQEKALSHLRRENTELRTKIGESEAGLQGQSESLSASTEALQGIRQRFQTVEDELVPLKDDFQTLQKKVRENILQRYQYQEFKEQLKQLSSSMTEMSEKLKEQAFELAPLKNDFKTLQNKVHQNDLQRHDQCQNLKEQVRHLSSSMTEMNGKLPEQLERFRQGFESLIEERVESLTEERVIQRTGGFQKQIEALQGLCNTLMRQVLENQKQNNQCEEDYKKAMEEIRRITPVMKSQPEIEDGMPQKLDKEGRTSRSSQKSTEELLLTFRAQQRLSEKMMKLLLENFQQDSKASESQGSSQAFSIKRSESQQREEKISVREPDEKDSDEREELNLDQQENEERSELTSETTLQENSKDDVPSIEAINSNTWESVGSDQD